jgi:heme/copper-type cytochrome/quinol oxidase subunit 1
MTAIPHPQAGELGHDASAAFAHGAHDQAAAHHEFGFFKKYIFSTDHKVIGLQFLFIGLAFMVIGGLEAMLIRWQLAWPDGEKKVPVLSRYLWLTTDVKARLGTIQAVDAATGLVTVGAIENARTLEEDSKVDDAVSIVGEGGAVVGAGKVVAVGADSVTVKPDDGVKPAAGNTVQGRRVPGLMPPEFYTATFTMHASIMIFFVIIPLLVGTFGNYLIPLKIGAPDMAFPFLNGVAFWTAVPAGAIMTASFFLAGGPSGAGWTSYPPLSSLPMNAGVLSYVAPVSGWEQFVMFLRVHDVDAGTMSTWTAIPLVFTFAALFLCFMYVCAYTVRLGHRVLNVPVAIAVSAVAAYASLLVVQRAAFDGQSAWFLSVFLLGFSSILGAVNYIATVIKLRCPGMTMFRMPLSVWALFITAVLVLLATPVLASVLFMNLLDHHKLTTFFLPFDWLENSKVPGVAGGGYPILHQHLFWFYSHPAVYIMILPAMGMVSDIMPVFARKPIFGYRPMIYALAAIAFLGFIVWAHHMFQSGMNPTLGTTFAISTMFIAVPSAIKTFNWLGTMWGGNIRFTAPMLHAVGFVSLFVIGGLSGIFMAAHAVDIQIHDTYFIVAHIHYVLFGGSMFGIWAGLTFWYPKMFGRMMNDRLGQIHFWLSFIFFNCTFFPMHILGIGGFPRRIYDYTYATYSHELYQPMNQFISYSAFALGLVQVLFVVNFIGSWIWGPRAGRNPWLAATLEWETPSPPPHGNFEKVPVVHHGPYEYASPLVEEDWLPQTRWVEEPMVPLLKAEA